MSCKPSPIEALLLAALMVCSWHYFWLMDDAFIYFRYADNLLFLGRGLVFNPGEYVEGFSSPLWMCLLLPLRFLQLDYWSMCRGLGLLFALTLGLLLIALNRALHPGSRAINLPLAIAAGHYGIAAHCSSGLETPLVQLWAALIALWLLRPSARWLQALAGLAPLVRPELALVALPAAVFCALRVRRVPVWFAASLLAGTGGWLLFRVYYYAELLPNTFYLKNGVHWQQGLWYLCNGVADQWWVPLLLAAWIAIAFTRSTVSATPGAPDASKRHMPERVMMVGLAALALTWVARIGGDMLYHRFLAAPTVLLLCSTGGVAELLVSRISKPRLAAIIAPALSLLAFGAAFASYPPQLDAHPWVSKREQQWHSIEDAGWHRRHPQLAPKPTRHADDQELLARYATFMQQPNPALLTPIAHPWCRRAFFEYTRYVVHGYGLTDPVLSRIEAPLKRPGHRALDGYALDLLAVVLQAPALAPNPTSSGRDAAMFRRAVNHGLAAPWIASNLTTINLIASKAYNHHNFLQNLRLAFTPVPRIQP